MVYRYMALVQCQDSPRTQHKSKSVTEAQSFLQFSLTDGPTRDQEEEITVEYLL